MRHSILVRLAIVTTVLLMPIGAHAAQSQSCSASETYEFAKIGSRHCEFTLPCPSAGGACTWQVAVAVSGIGTVHGWIEDTQTECSGVNSCSGSFTLTLGPGTSRGYMCLMDSPVIGVNMALSCSGTAK